jgi:hypothetical protein
MSVHCGKSDKCWVIRFRDGDGKQRSITANALNFAKYELPVPERITSRTVRRLEAEVLRRETAADGSIRSADRRKTMYLDVVGDHYNLVLVGGSREAFCQCGKYFCAVA